jgi:NTE family protein
MPKEPKSKKTADALRESKSTSTGEELKTAKSRKQSKTALVLGGGGFTGAVYEMGALRALNLLTVNHTANNFDIYVGTSAGSFVSALTVNGITPEEMIRAINRDGATFAEIDRRVLLRPNYREYVEKGLALPWNSFKIAAAVVRSLPSLGAVDIAVALAEALPSGLYTGSGLEEYVESLLTENGRSNSFNRLKAELYLAATDIDTCERIIFGGPGWTDIPISRAVHASTALPMIYKPVECKDRVLIDGGVTSTTNVDIAVDAGADLVFVINPLVPFVNEDQATRGVAQMGFPKIAYQAFKLLTYQRLHNATQHWNERYPDVDIVLIEPDPDDRLMFETNILDYGARIDVARHGFESVTRKLSEDFDSLQPICEKHGVKLSAPKLQSVVKKTRAAEGRRARWRRLLE